MPFNGSGVYSPPSLPGSFNPAIIGQNATATDWNTLLQDLQSALSLVICRDGQSTIASDIPWSNRKIINLADPTNAQDAATKNYVDNSVLNLTNAIGGPTIRDYLAGLGTSNNSGSPDTTIDVAAGIAADSTVAQMMVLSAGSINCSTNGANGLDVGSLGASTSYHTFAIGKTDGTTALLASASPTSPTLPSGYTLFRRIASFKTDASSHIRRYVQQGNYFYINEVQEISSNTARVMALFTLTGVPAGIVLQPILYASGNTINGDGATVIAAPATNATLLMILVSSLNQNVSGILSASGGIIGPPTNTSAQINLRADLTSSSSNWVLTTQGWLDTRGRDA